LYNGLVKTVLDRFREDLDKLKMQFISKGKVAPCKIFPKTIFSPEIVHLASRRIKKIGRKNLGSNLSLFKKLVLH